MSLIRTRWAAVFAALFYAAAPAAADDNDPVWSLTSENDIFGGTDRNYSNGLRLERFSQPNRVHPWLARTANALPFIDVERAKLRQGFGISHAIFTPEDIEAVVPDPTDRPYAGWLAVSGTIIATDGDIQDSLQINLGIVGPSAGAEWVQTNWHKIVNVAEPKGWDAQLHDEFGFEIVGQRQYRFDGPMLFDMIETDLGATGGFSLGNVNTYATGGLMMRIGKDLDADFGPPRIRPSLSGGGAFTPDQPFGGYLFAGIETRAIAHTIFLDGNTFQDSASVDKKVWVGDLTGGWALSYRDVQLAFTYVHRTEEFKGQDGPQRFGAVSISVAY